MIIQIIASTSKGKSTIALKIAEMLKTAGADVTIKDHEISDITEKKLLQNFTNIIKNLRSNGQKITIKTCQINRIPKKLSS